jgi:hypothetical protein
MSKSFSHEKRCKEYAYYENKELIGKKTFMLTKFFV